jgi:ABC-2 type transport system permease protein
LQGLPNAPRVTLDDFAGQRDDVFATFGERWYYQPVRAKYPIQSCIQPSLLNRVVRIRGGIGNQTNIRRGRLSLRLLRPIHPFVTYAATHLASIPLRSLVALPFAGILLVSTGRSALTTDPLLIALFFVSLAGAWAITFFLLVLIGSLGFFIEKSLAIFNLHLGLFAVLSGFLVPLPLLPEWAQQIARFAPFRYMLGFPVETLLGFHDRGQALTLLAVQWLFVALVAVAATLVWRAGVRRYEAFGS